MFQRFNSVTELSFGAADLVSASFNFQNYAGLGLDVPAQLGGKTITIQGRSAASGTWQSTGVSFSPAGAELRAFVGDDASRLFPWPELRLSLNVAAGAACVARACCKS